MVQFLKFDWVRVGHSLRRSGEVSATCELSGMVRAARECVRDIRRGDMLVERNAQICSGAPVFKGTRIPVAQIVEQFRAGVTISEIAEDYPQLSEEALQYAEVRSRMGDPSGRPKRDLRLQRTASLESDANPLPADPALQKPVAASAFRPIDVLISQANERLADVEGYALEDLAAQLYEERSRLGIGDFPLSEKISGYWDRADTEIDLVAVAEETRAIRFGTCKRQSDRLPKAFPALFSATRRFLTAHKQFAHWQVEYVAIAPSISAAQRLLMKEQGVIPQSLTDLCESL